MTVRNELQNYNHVDLLAYIEGLTYTEVGSHGRVGLHEAGLRVEVAEVG
jgi:hypothetical protein